MVALALALAITLSDYTPADASFNAMSTAGASHVFGSLGSITADLLWQYAGAPSFFFVVILGAWGWRVGRGLGLDFLWGRLTASALSVLAAGIALASLFPQPPLELTVRWGGALGKLGAQAALPLLPRTAGPAMLAFVMGLLAAATLYMACALTLGEWNHLLRKAHDMARRVIGAASRFAQNLWFRLRGHRDGDAFYDDELEDEDSEQEQDDEGEQDDDRAAQQPKPQERIVIKRQQTLAKASSRQTRLPLHSNDDHPLPPLDLLHWPEEEDADVPELSQESLEKNAKLLESVLADFGVYGKITKVNPGPVVTLYELEPSPGTRAARVISLADDVARNMSAGSVRIASVQGRNVIGIELPNKKRETVYLRELLSSDAYQKSKIAIPLALGKDISGAPVVVDVERMPHLLIAGTTGSGKSVAINTMILSILYRLPPEECRFIMIDPKILELSKYQGIPHLLAPVVTDSKKAVMALKWTVREMEERYRAMSKMGVTKLESYNMRLREAAKKGETLVRTVQTGFDRETGKPIYEEQPLDLTPLPNIIVVVDEMADMMLLAGKEIEGAVQRLAQMARAAGIHLLMATQRPSVDVLTGTIKANLPTRISFQVTSKIDSRTILSDQGGAEQLLGQGDMLYREGGGRITRVHGPFVSEGEVEKVVNFLKAQGEPDYLDEVTKDDAEEGDNDSSSDASASNDLYDQAVDIVLRDRQASASYIQRRLSIGYNRAAKLIERMEDDGIISGRNHVGKREIFGRTPDKE